MRKALAIGRISVKTLRLWRVFVRSVLISIFLAALTSQSAAADTPLRFVQVSGGYDHALAVSEDGRVFAWGANSSGQLGDGSLVARTHPVEVGGLPSDDPVTKVAAGTSYSLALTEAGVIYAWGSNASGKLGIRSYSPDYSVTPRAVSQWRSGVANGGTKDTELGGTLTAMPPIVDIVVGSSSSYAVGADGYAYAWGSSGDGELGAGISAWTNISTDQRRHTPRRMSTSLGQPITDVVSIASGWSHALVVRSNGSVWGTGDEGQGQLSGDLDNGNTEPVAWLTRITALDSASIVKVAAGRDTSYAVTASGGLYSFGDFSFGVLCRSTATWATPTAVPGVTGVTDITVGNRMVIFSGPGTTVRGCGANGRNQLAMPNTGPGSIGSEVSSPTVLTSLTGFKGIDFGEQWALGVSSDGGVSTWGNNSEGQLGNGIGTRIGTPRLIPGVTNAEMVFAGKGNSFALMPGGSLLAWGRNTDGSLGIDSTAQTASATPVDDLTGVTNVSTGRATQYEADSHFSPHGQAETHTLALKTDGTVWGWGSNGFGQIGDGTVVDRDTPVEVDVPGTVIQIAAGGVHSMALNSLGDVYTWGYSRHGQLGTGLTGDGAKLETPTLVASLPDIVQIGAGSLSSYARTAAGALYGWGYNSSGRLGTGNSDNQATPTLLNQTLETVPWTAAEMQIGTRFGLALLPDGNYLGWGSSFDGEFYQTTGQRGWPTARFADVIQPFRPFTALSLSNHGLAIRDNGSVLAWGSNELGQVGGSSTNNVWEGTPVLAALPGPATSVAAGDFHSLAIVGSEVYGWGTPANGRLGFDYIEDVATPYAAIAPGWLALTETSGGGNQYFRDFDRTLFVNPTGSGVFTLRFGTAAGDTAIDSATFPGFGSGWTGGGAGALNDGWYEHSYSFAAGADGGTHTVQGLSGGSPVRQSNVEVIPDSAAPVGGSIVYSTKRQSSTIANLSLDLANDLGSGIASSILERRTTNLTSGGCNVDGWTVWGEGGSIIGRNQTVSLNDAATCYQFRVVFTDNVGNQTMRTGGVLERDSVPVVSLAALAAESSGTIEIVGSAFDSMHTFTTFEVKYDGAGANDGTICTNPTRDPGTGTFNCPWDTSAVADGAYTVSLSVKNDAGTGAGITRTTAVNNGGGPTPPTDPPGGGGPPVITPDNFPPVVAINTPKCAKKLKRAKCKKWLASAAAWKKVTGSAADAGAITKVEAVLHRKNGKKWQALVGKKFKNVKTRALAEKSIVVAKSRGSVWSLSLPKLSAGTWTLRARAVDASGNTSGWLKRTVKIR
jgi:alpha-tubulin suppressor-like RCC1 family protein